MLGRSSVGLLKFALWADDFRPVGFETSGPAILASYAEASSVDARFAHIVQAPLIEADQQVRRTQLATGSSGDLHCNPFATPVRQ